MILPPACVPEAASVAPVSSPSMVAPGEGTRVALGAVAVTGAQGNQKKNKKLNRKNHGKFMANSTISIRFAV